VKNQQMQQLFIQFINYVWYLLHVLALHCHPQGAFLVASEKYLIEEQSSGVVRGDLRSPSTSHGNVTPKHVGDTIHN
jgi:hypothetical protein